MNSLKSQTLSSIEHRHMAYQVVLSATRSLACDCDLVFWRSALRKPSKQTLNVAKPRTGRRLHRCRFLGRHAASVLNCARCCLASEKRSSTKPALICSLMDQLGLWGFGRSGFCLIELSARTSMASPYLHSIGCPLVFGQSSRLPFELGSAHGAIL